MKVGWPLLGCVAMVPLNPLSRLALALCSPSMTTREPTRSLRLPTVTSAKDGQHSPMPNRWASSRTTTVQCASATLVTTPGHWRYSGGAPGPKTTRSPNSGRWRAPSAAAACGSEATLPSSAASSTASSRPMEGSTSSGAVVSARADDASCSGASTLPPAASREETDAPKSSSSRQPPLRRAAPPWCGVWLECRGVGGAKAAPEAEAPATSSILQSSSGLSAAASFPRAAFFLLPRLVGTSTLGFAIAGSAIGSAVATEETAEAPMSSSSRQSFPRALAPMCRRPAWTAPVEAALGTARDSSAMVATEEAEAPMTSCQRQSLADSSRRLSRITRVPWSKCTSEPPSDTTSSSPGNTHPGGTELMLGAQGLVASTPTSAARRFPKSCRSCGRWRGLSTLISELGRRNFQQGRHSRARCGVAPLCSGPVAAGAAAGSVQLLPSLPLAARSRRAMDGGLSAAGIN
mmetsp:Transcript_150696/g.420054  ORF Transcript_150696/g.420054 Transcript_150696/m.420054 type:complete len:462 (+) Transcript_150696:366-1751(+)